MVWQFEAKLINEILLDSHPASGLLSQFRLGHFIIICIVYGFPWKTIPLANMQQETLFCDPQVAGEGAKATLEVAR